MKDNVRDILLALDKTESAISRIFTFWRPAPVYRIFGPTGDREYFYREGDHLLKFVVDYLSGHSGIDMVVDGDIGNQWEPPYNHEFFSEEKRQEILGRIEEHFTKNKARFQMVTAKSQNEYTELDGYVVRSFYSSDDAAFVAIIDALPGCYADAPTRTEALESLRAEKAEWIRLMTERGHEIPAPEMKAGSDLA